MPYLVIRSVIPPHKIDELIKKLMEVTPKYPPDPSIDEHVFGATKATEQGSIWMNIFEVKEGQLDAAYVRWRKAMAELRNVEGFKYAIDVWATDEESRASIGVTPPEQ
ncbi:MAG: hypothetical protein ACXABG_02480 [Promethearchaeota archaeon]